MTVHEDAFERVTLTQEKAIAKLKTQLRITMPSRVKYVYSACVA